MTFLMLVCAAESGSPTREMPLMLMIWSPTFSWFDLAAGPTGFIWARTTVGSIEPQPLSTWNGRFKRTWEETYHHDSKSLAVLFGHDDVFLCLFPGEHLQLVAHQFLGVEHLLVVDLAQIGRVVDAVGSQELHVGYLETGGQIRLGRSHLKGLADGLRYEGGLLRLEDVADDLRLSLDTLDPEQRITLEEEDVYWLHCSSLSEADIRLAISTTRSPMSAM